jgi:hypothetical protein
MLIVLLPTAGALLGSVVGALVTYRMSSRTYRLDRLKLISSWAKSEEVEKARVAAYRDLWKCLGGVSTHSTDEIVRNLPTVQERLQEWYYGSGGGLFLTGAAEEGGSAKTFFFGARDLHEACACYTSVGGNEIPGAFSVALPCAGDTKFTSQHLNSRLDCLAVT